jgi:drug/metabolite transporter (DMT)-like permease
MALAPLFTALLARVLLGYRQAARTWVAIALAGAGIAWMYGHDVQGGRHLLGTLVALAVPIAAALNWTLIQSLRGRHEAPDMLPAVLLGAALSAALTLPLAWPLSASARDIGLLSMLGVFQLAIPCLIAVVVARTLPAPEISLLGLLEVLFGVAWAWLGAGEAPTAAVLGGGALVLIALAGNELLALGSTRSTAATRST